MVKIHNIYSLRNYGHIYINGITRERKWFPTEKAAKKYARIERFKTLLREV